MEWPTTINEAITAVSMFIGLVLTIGGLLGKWLTNRLNNATARLEADLNGLSTRLDERLEVVTQAGIECRERIAANAAIIESQRYEIQGINHHRQSHEKELSEMREMIRGLAQAVEVQRDVQSTELRHVSEAVTEIKTTVRLLLKKGALD